MSNNSNECIARSIHLVLCDHVKWEKVLERKPTHHRCQNFCAIGTEYCWYHLKNYMNLIVQPTREHDREGKLVKQLGLFACLGLLRKLELRRVGASINGPIFTIGSPVIYYLPEHITQEMYDDRYPKGRGPYTHRNINPASNYEHPYLDGAAVRSLGTIVQHTDHYPNVELHMLSHNGHKLASLVAVHDIYNGDEILLKYDHNADDSRYNMDQSHDGISYGTKQLRFKTQGLWKQQRDKQHPKDPVIYEGLHQGQKYDRRYIPGIPH